MDWIHYIALFVVVGYLAYCQWHGPSPYGGRACTGRAWKRALPNARKEVIRVFLECFVNGMAFSSTTRLKFHPNDQVLDVYRSIYGGRTPVSDSMECEIFLENLELEFGKPIDELISVWHSEVTLGELFAFATIQPDAPADPKTALRFSSG